MPGGFERIAGHLGAHGQDRPDEARRRPRSRQREIHLLPKWCQPESAGAAELDLRLERDGLALGGRPGKTGAGHHEECAATVPSESCGQSLQGSERPFQSRRALDLSARRSEAVNITKASGHSKAAPSGAVTSGGMANRPLKRASAA